MKEQQDAVENKRFAALKEKADEAMWLKDKERKAKEIVDAVAKKKQKEKKGGKKDKAVTESSSEGEVWKVVEATLAKEEKGTDGDTEGERPSTSKKEALKKLKEVCDEKWRAMGPAVSTVENKRKWALKSSSVVESGEEGTSGLSKQVKLDVTGPAEDEEELMGNGK